MRDLKIEAVRLRQEERLSSREIGDRLNIPKRTVAEWVQPYPLLKKEQIKKLVDAAKRGHRNKKNRGEESKFHKIYPETTLSRAQKGRIAEAAVLLRLVLNGFESYDSALDGQKIDRLVRVPSTGKIVRLQVKWASAGVGRGLPQVHLRCSNGRLKERQYRVDECDVMVAYDYYTDTAYVFRFLDIATQKCVSIRPEAEERWELLRGL